jgi:hypothetical protein
MPTYLMSLINNWLNQFWFSYEFFEIKIVKPQKGIDVKNTNDNYFHHLFF